MNVDQIQENRLKKAIATGAMALGAMGSLGATEKIDGYELYNQIAQHEGIERTVYKDTKGIPTIGIGFNLESRHNKQFLKSIGIDINDLLAGKPLTDKQIKILYNFSLKTAWKDVNSVIPNFRSHPKEVRMVLIDMMFNLGKPRFSEFKKMIKAVNNRDYDTAANEMIDSVWYRQVKSRGVNLVQMMRGVER